MPKYRKRPVVIEAEQYISGAPCPRGICQCLINVAWVPHVHTIHDSQVVAVASGDWIIPEPDGKHFYPCKDEIFRATYKPVDDPS